MFGGMITPDVLTLGIFAFGTAGTVAVAYKHMDAMREDKQRRKEEFVRDEAKRSEPTGPAAGDSPGHKVEIEVGGSHVKGFVTHVDYRIIF